MGLHWILLQSVAWTAMIVSFSAQGTLGEALEKTFDGEHPCALCQAVQQGSQTDRDDSEPASTKVLKFVELRFSPVRIFPPAASSTYWNEKRCLPWDAGQAPEPPPPRCLPA